MSQVWNSSDKTRMRREEMKLKVVGTVLVLSAICILPTEAPTDEKLMLFASGCCSVRGGGNVCFGDEECRYPCKEY
jgi:hypothetical protein